jgi:hypothetical protein
VIFSQGHASKEDQEHEHEHEQEQELGTPISAQFYTGFDDAKLRLSESSPRLGGAKHDAESTIPIA